VDRDESWGKGNGTFREIAHHLAGAGFAVLRYDPRGIPKSGGYYLGAGLYEFGHDAASALNYLKTLKEVDRQRIFVLGHGYGAKAAIIGALSTPDIRGVVLLAGVYDREPEHRRRTMQFQLQADGRAAAEVERILEQHRQFIEKIEIGRYFQYEDYFLDPALADWIVQAMKLNPESPAWWRDNLVFDAVTAASKLPCPILMLHGECDYLVDSREVQTALDRLHKLSKKDVELKSFAGLNHRFIPVQSPREAYQFDRATVMTKSDASYPFESRVLGTLSSWLSGRAGTSTTPKK